MPQPIRVAIAGLGFGAEFIPIYQAHPYAEVHAVCRRNAAELNKVADHFGVPHRYTDFDELLQDPAVDVVHINSPIGLHGQQSIAALRAGKHVMCTVPMATSVEECQTICELVAETGLRYMMAETVVYSREYLFIKDLYDRGELGEVQYMQASHPQDMEGWPDYWRQMIPMHYATHIVSPVLGLVDQRAEAVSCFGSGRISDELAEESGCRFAVETAHVRIKDHPAAAHLWRTLFDTARQYRESFDVYGTKKSFEWTLVENQPHVLHTAKKPEPEIPQPVAVPDFAERLPEPIRRFTQTIEDADHLSFLQGAGHGGSHPHLAHEMVTALRNGRDPYPNATTSANWTCVGLCAHQSAMADGVIVPLPEFTLA
ncbi:MAG: Gfo/Idh/MocA family oxidoreductase [Planctomycetota bacterium]